MNIKLLYFSPTSTTKITLNNIAKGFSLKVNSEIDFTDINKRNKSYEFSKNDIVIIGVPVYGGRVPAVMTNALKKLDGNGARAVIVVVYGNRAYDNALIELFNTVETTGFKTISAAAFIAEHSFTNEIATDRPDEKDVNLQISYGQNIEQLCIEKKYNKLSIPGEVPTTDILPKSLAPQSKSTCVRCNVCVNNCPVEAIELNNPNRTEIGKCILCYRCVKICPNDSRVLESDSFHNKISQMALKLTDRKEPEIFM